MKSNADLNKLIARLGELPPMPQVAQKALELIRDPESNMADLARVLAMDEAMASLVLRWANSAYYGLRNPVSTVQQAVTFLGQRTLHSLVLAASVASLLERPAPGYGLERGELWRHALGVAAGARLLAAPFGNILAEEAYHAGLLCDIGKLALEMLLRSVDLSQPHFQNRPFSELEVELFGVDHATLGAELARRWHLPDTLVDAIAHHHLPSQAQKGAVLAAAVHLADAALMMMGIGLGRDGLQYPLDPVACQRLGWSENRFGELADKVLPFIEEADKFIRLRSM
jgi:putative nucleotidyltransferase with HDIG domain